MCNGVPFDKNGNMKSYSSYEQLIGHYKPLDTTFEAELRFTTTSRGRSSVKFHFIDDSTGIEYEMFLTEFERVVMLGLAPISLKGLFGFHKKGSNFGIRYIGKEE